MAEKGPGGAEVGRVSVRVVPNTAGFRRRAKAELEAETRGLEVEIDVKANLKGFREKIKAAAAGLSAQVDVEANAATVRQRINAATKGLRAQVDVDVDRSALRRLSDSLQNIKGPSFGSGINPAGYAAIFAGITAVAAPLFGLLTTSLLTLPGLIASIGTPVAALTLGLDGLKAAASRLAEPFKALKDQMSAVTEKAFTPVFDQLGKIFPTLGRALPTVTQGMADVARSVVDVITSSSGMQRIEDTIRNIGAAISKAGPGFAAFTDGFVSLAKSFSEKMPDLSEWFNGAGKSFSDWVSKITADGTLSKAFDGLGGTLKTLMEAIGSMAAEGFKFMQDPKNIEDFNAGLRSIGDSLTSIVTLSNQLNNLGDLFKNLVPSFDFASIWADLTAPFTSPDAPWRTMWADMQATTSAAWSVVTGIVSGAVITISTLVNSIGARISGIWNGIQSAAASAWQSVVTAVQGAWQSITAAVQQGVDTAVQFVAEFPGKVAAALSNLAQTGMEAGRALVQGFINGLDNLIPMAIAKAKELAQRAANAVKSALGINSPSKLFTEFGQFTAEGFGNGIQNGFQEVMAQAKAMAKGVFEAFQEVFPNGGGPAIAFNLGSVQQQMAQISSQASDLRASLNTAVTDAIPTQQLSQDTKEMRAQLDLQQQQLELEKKRLQVEKAQTEDKARRAEIQAEIDKLDLQKKQLAYQEQQLKVAGQSTDQADQMRQSYQSMVQSMASVPKDIAMANANQFMSDLGMSGNGALQALGQYGLDFAKNAAGTNFNFNVSNADEAIAIMKAQQNKDSLQYRRY